jgi:hypothetical protein
MTDAGAQHAAQEQRRQSVPRPTRMPFCAAKTHGTDHKLSLWPATVNSALKLLHVWNTQRESEHPLHPCPIGKGSNLL